MAKLIDTNLLLDTPKNVPMFVEIRDMAKLSFQVAWRYNERYHSIEVLGRRLFYDIDNWNRTWRAWDKMPTAAERESTAWL